jgi:hypothetical protein
MGPACSPDRANRKLGAHPFFARRNAADPASGATVAAAGALTAPRRGWFPRAAESAGALFSLTISIVMVAAIVALLFAFMREVRRDTTAAHSSVELKPASERG